MPPTSPEPASVRPPHPLAVELIAALGAGEARVIDFASGSGRNARALRAAGFQVLEIADPGATAAAVARVPSSVQAVISTHGLLHGTINTIADALDAIAGKLVPGGRLYATFASTRDARYGQGTEIEPFVYAPDDGDERGVPHAYFDEPRLRGLLSHSYVLESIEERSADVVAGSWAHPRTPLHNAVHWFVKARV
jgi:hypothetical protein